MRRSVSETLTDHRSAMFSLLKHHNAIVKTIAKSALLCGFVVKQCARYVRHYCTSLLDYRYWNIPFASECEWQQLCAVISVSQKTV